MLVQPFPVQSCDFHLCRAAFNSGCRTAFLLTTFVFPTNFTPPRQWLSSLCPSVSRCRRLRLQNWTHWDPHGMTEHEEADVRMVPLDDLLPDVRCAPHGRQPQAHGSLGGRNAPPTDETNVRPTAHPPTQQAAHTIMGADRHLPLCI